MLADRVRQGLGTQLRYMPPGDLLVEYQLTCSDQYWTGEAVPATI